MIVYQLYHIREKGDGADDQKLIGIYTSRQNANAAISRVKDQPGFRDYPNGFQVFEHTLDQDDWTEGFIPADEA